MDQNVGILDPAFDFFAVLQFRSGQDRALERDRLTRRSFPDTKELADVLQTSRAIIEQIVLFGMSSDGNSKTQLAELLADRLNVFNCKFNLNFFHCFDYTLRKSLLKFARCNRCAQSARSYCRFSFRCPPPPGV